MGRTHRRSVFGTLGYSGYVMIEGKKEKDLYYNNASHTEKQVQDKVFCPKSRRRVTVWAPSVEIT